MDISKLLYFFKKACFKKRRQLLCGRDSWGAGQEEVEQGAVPRSTLPFFGTSRTHSFPGRGTIYSQGLASTSRGPSRPLPHRQLSCSPKDSADSSSPLLKRKNGHFCIKFVCKLKFD